MASKRDLNLRVRVESAEFMGWLRRYAEATGKGTAEALEEQMRRVMLAAGAFTPPFPSRGFGQARVWQRTPSSRRVVRWSDHQKAGRNAMVKDLFGKAGRDDGIFEVRHRGWFETMISAIELLGPGGGFDVSRLDRARMVATLRKELPLGWEESAVRAKYKEILEPNASMGAMRSHHRRHRSRNTGRVFHRSRKAAVIGRARVSDKMVVTKRVMDRYLREAWREVGTLKSGWLEASERLGLSLRWPAWVRKARARAGGTGRKRLRGTPKYMVAINQVAYAGRQDRNVRIAAQALRFAGENLASQVEAAERGAWRRTGGGKARGRRRR